MHLRGDLARVNRRQQPWACERLSPWRIYKITNLSRSVQLAEMQTLRSSFLGSGRFTTSLVAAPRPAGAMPARTVTSMAKKKGVRLIVTLECTEARAAGGTPSRYTSQKVRDAIAPGCWGRCGEGAASYCTQGWHAIPIAERIAVQLSYSALHAAWWCVFGPSRLALSPAERRVFAEQEEHPRAAGADEVQQVPAAANSAPRDQVSGKFLCRRSTRPLAHAAPQL